MRTTFLVDGFNLYHSIVDIAKDVIGCNVKWLDICSLCKSYLHLIGKRAMIETVYYIDYPACCYIFSGAVIPMR
jgi:hypothetical protein